MTDLVTVLASVPSSVFASILPNDLVSVLTVFVVLFW